MYMPKSAKPLDQQAPTSGYMPKSARPIAQPQQEGGFNALSAIGRLLNVPSAAAGGVLEAGRQFNQGEYQAPQTGVRLPQFLAGRGDRLDLGELVPPTVVGAVRGVRDNKAVMEELPRTVGVDPNTPAGVALGFAGELATPDPLDVVAVGKGISKFNDLVLKPFKKTDDVVLQAAEEIGVQLPLSAQTQNKFIKQAEAVLQNSLFGQSIANKVTKAFEDVAKKQDEITKRFIKEQDFTKIGQSLEKGFEDFTNSFMDKKTELYASVPKRINSVVINPTETINLLESLVKAKKNILGDEKSISFYSSMLDDIKKRLPKNAGISIDPQTKLISFKAGSEGAPTTYKEIKETLKLVGDKVKNFADPIVGQEKGNLRRLYAALATDLETSLRTAEPALYEALKKADAFYEQGTQLLSSNVGRAIRNSAPEDVFKMLSKPGQETKLGLLKEVVGEQAYGDFQQGVLQKIFNKAVDSKGVISSQKLENTISQYGEQSLRKFLTDEQFSSLTNLRKELAKVDLVSKTLKQGTSPASGSQTAFLANVTGTIAAAVTNPLLAAQYVLGSLAVTKGFESDALQRFLLNGANITGAANAGVTAANALKRSAFVADEAGKVVNANVQANPQEREDLKAIQRMLDKEKEAKLTEKRLP